MARILITVTGPKGVKRYAIPANELERFEMGQSDVEGQQDHTVGEQSDTSCTAVWDSNRGYTGGI